MTDVESNTHANGRESRLAPSEGLYVVGIGASAGGLDAIERLFAKMPVDTGMAFVVVQHLSPNFESLMDELLARHTSMKIHRVVDGMPLQPNGIYLIPPKKNMILSNGRLLLTDQDSKGSLNLPIDIFFRSLAQDAGARAIAIVLSGTGSDGTRGIREVHDAGGLVLVQDLDSASFDGMPRSAALTDIVDIVSPPDKMPDTMVRYLDSPTEFHRGVIHYTGDLAKQGERYEIFRLFWQKFGIDFSLYKPATMDRRIERRVQLTRSKDIKNYVKYLNNHDEEIETLYRDLLVEVTQFFRDPDAFEILRNDVLPDLIDRAPSGAEIRAWVPGCATGEEAYSLAMLLDDAISRTTKDVTFKVFATDVHNRSLETASTGVYPVASLEPVPKEFRTKYFSESGDLIHFTREVRQRVIFAPNDITRDPPFTKIDLISCRNVLIYLEPQIQKKVLSLFHFGLQTGGILFLGPSESLGDLSGEFEPIDRHWRIYRKQRDVRLPIAGRLPLNSAISRVVSPRPSFVAKSPFRDVDHSLTDAFQELLSSYVPPSLVVNEHFDLVHSFGDASQFLKQPEGRSTLDVLKMVKGDIRMAISAALHKANQQRSMVVYKGVRTTLGDEQRQYKIVVNPYFRDNVKLFLISFEEVEQPSPPPANTEQTFNATEQSTERIEVLEQELNYTRESLQSTVEELETSNEELQSTNEELIASNEELQSTNEELHSVNEELYTVNSEHKQKIDELTQLTSDMDNLLKSTDIGTVFLDRELKIRMFTPAISAAFNILEQDVGRPIDHIAFRLSHPDLMRDINEVMITGEPIESECKGNDENGTYLLRVVPYRTATNRMDGVALTLTDITVIREAEEAKQRNEDLARANKDLQDFVYAVSHDLQAPLRHLCDSCQELNQNFDVNDYSESSKFLTRVTSSSTQLTKMLQDLLTYSRVATRGKRPTLVDTQTLFDAMLKDHAELIESTSATVQSEGLPTLRADDRQLQRVLAELVENALKYQTTSEPQVQVSCTRSDGDWLFSVSDNGVGIEERHYERIFVIFQRLEFVSGVTGNGLGLALSKRIVERHGGHIWLESIPGEGTTFFFTIPA